jgi:hypothetical protein
MQNRVFFPQAALDQWLSEGAVDLHGTELTITSEGRRYRIAEAIHVLREVTGTPDTHELVGRVKSVAFLQELGAEVVETSAILGDNAYDVVPGWLGTPVGTFDEHVAGRSNAKKKPRGAEFEEPKTDEDLLAKFLVKSL